MGGLSVWSAIRSSRYGLWDFLYCNRAIVIEIYSETLFGKERGSQKRASPYCQNRNV